MTLELESISLNPGQLVSLFELDLSPFGGNVERFFDGDNVSDGLGWITWKGNFYFPRPVQVTGFELTADGRPPRPKLSVSNIGNAMGVLAAQYQDFVGAQVTRWRTFRHYLDGEAQADPDQHYPPDIFLVNRKITQTNREIVFELSNPLDQTSKTLPGRIVQKRYCPWRYRGYNATTDTFDYSQAECPYTGSDYYNEMGEVETTAAQDKCGKRLSDCKLRFPNQALPFGGFPGIRRIS